MSCHKEIPETSGRVITEDEWKSQMRLSDDWQCELAQRLYLKLDSPDSPQPTKAFSTKRVNRKSLADLPQRSKDNGVAENTATGSILDKTKAVHTSDFFDSVMAECSGKMNA